MATTENGIYYPDDKTEKATILSDLQKMAKSIDTAINNNKFDPTQINNSIQELEVDISDLQESQEEQNSDIEALTNALPTETQEGENINIKGTIPTKFKEFVVGGNSKQESRSGKNLLPYPYNTIENTIIEDLGDGRLIINGNITSNTSVSIQNFYLKAGSYKLLFNTENIPNNSYILIQNIDTGAFLVNGARKNVDFILETNTNIRLSVVFVAGTYNNYKMDLMILEATEEDETWEQYGAMPSPEYPSEIQNVEGNVNVSVCNKNIYENIEDGYINTTTGNNQSSSIYKRSIGSILLKANKQLKLIRYDENKGIRFYYYDLNGNYIESSVNSNVSELNTNIYNKDLLLRYVLMNTTSAEDVKCMLCDVNSTSNYIEHQEQNILFPLSQGQKLYLGDYLASDGIHHVRKQIELDGTEDWQQYNNRLYLYIEDAINTISSTEIPNIKSNMFIATNFNNMSNNPDNAISYNLLGNEDQHKGISFYSNKYFTDVSALKSWLASQKEAGTPIIIEYELAEEEIETYTEEQQEAYNQICNLKAYEEETNIFSTNETSPIFKVTAVKDVNSVITQLNQQILEIAGGN